MILYYHFGLARGRVAMKSKLLFLFPRSESIPFSSQTLMLVPMLNTHRLKSLFYLFIYLFTFLFTDLDPCLNVECPSFGVCRTYSAHESRCACFQDCPSYQDPVCTANGTTYDNKCWHELSYCRGLENNLVYHPGSCEGKH